MTFEWIAISIMIIVAVALLVIGVVSFKRERDQ